MRNKPKELKDFMSQVDEVDKFLAKQDPKSGLDLIDKIRREIATDEGKQNKIILARTYYWEQLCWKLLHNLKNVQAAHKKGITLYQELEDNIGVSNMLRDLGLTYEYVGQYDKAIKYLSEAIKALNLEGETEEVTAYRGVTNSKIGAIYARQGSLKEGEKFAIKGYQQLLKTNHLFYQLTALNPLILISILRKDTNTAKRHIKKAENLISELAIKDGYLNERRYSEILGAKAHLNILLDKPQNVLENFTEMMKYMLLAKQQTRKRVWDTTKIEVIYNYLVSNGFKERINTYFQSFADQNKKEIDWTPSSLVQEFK